MDGVVSGILLFVQGIITSQVIIGLNWPLPLHGFYAKDISCICKVRRYTVQCTAQNFKGRKILRLVHQKFPLSKFGANAISV